jgi:hypothetical protein
MAELLPTDGFRERSEKPSNPNKGDLLVYHVFEKENYGKFDHLYKIHNPRHALKVINELADSQVNDESIIFNVIGLIEFDGDEWCDWCNDEGDDINDTVFDDINFRCFNCQCIADNSEKVMLPNWDKKHFTCKQCLRDEGIPEEEWVK